MAPLAAAGSAAPPGTRHVEHCMGTVFSLDVRDPGTWADAFGEVTAWLHRVDAVFSTHRDGSDLSRLRRGKLTLREADPMVGDVLDLCAQVQAETGGWFTARWRGGLDPTGLVKGWAVERASALLRARGSGNHAVNGGGDVQLAGEAAPGRPWRVGVADPHIAGAAIATVAGGDRAVATSGTAERGAHIVDPFTGRPATCGTTGLASVTVTGPSLTRADAYATAAYAMGPAGLSWVRSLPGYDALTVSADGRLQRTPGYGR